ncbi:MAG: flagellar hook-associated protein FlgK [Rhizobiales bacterium 65-79]|jgi:flagellar hook-associated protein 1 FlgK|nr:flagellar hook-associated protein FlgK [Hyphomicrobiales bacterium]OJU01691.1 MAG: flagellar hook-associated protein FlgK [Rhizobiales bacterium 65-79]
MSLTTALNIAQSALFNTTRQTTVVSQNISNSGNADYARRSATVVSTSPGATVVNIQRTTDDVLFRSNLQALSSYQGQSTLLNGMENLDQAVNGVDNADSAASALGDFQQALNLYSATPSNTSLGENTIESARQLVRNLNDGTQAIQSFRTDMDNQISQAVGDLNNLLNSFNQANRAIVAGNQTGADVSDIEDQRDGLLKQISQYVSISTIKRGNGDMVLMTSDGATLYETVPRTVTFDPTAGYSATTVGSAIKVDGVPLSAGTGGNTTASGSLQAMVQLRDSTATTMQSQLDEIARGLISSFAEKDPSGTATLPDTPGLFTWPGAPAMPADGTLVPGLAGLIKVNPAMDSTVGGSASVLRDGGAGGTGYVANTAGNASYSDLLIGYSQNLDKPIAFDPAAGAGSNASVMTYSTNAISSFEAARKDASDAADNKNALMTRTAQALSNSTGVNIDEEMSTLLDLEHSYQASARMISTVDSMLGALLDAVS